MKKYRAILISLVVSLFIFSGCSSEPTPPPIPTLPTTTLQSWQSAALQDWSINAFKNVLGDRARSKYTHNWSGCKPRFILTDSEIGFCQGFNLAKWKFNEHWQNVRRQNFPTGGYKKLQTSLTLIKQECGSGGPLTPSGLHHVRGTDEFFVPEVDDFYSLSLREATNTKDWYEGCISGFSFQIKLRELFEKTPAAKAELAWAKEAYKIRIAEEVAKSSTSADEDQPNSSNSKGGVGTGDDSESGYWVSKCRTITELNPDYNDSDPSSIVDNLRGPSRFVTKRKCTDVWVKN
jgi:hypothetical protein